MFIHFSDWTNLTESLDLKNIRHGGRIIKAYSSSEDPRLKLGKPSLFIFEIDGSPFKRDEFFAYENRNGFTGQDLEYDLNQLGLDETLKPYVRALVRFGNLPEIQSCQDMMKEQKDGCWLYNHPFEDLDIRPHPKVIATHLDIYYPETLERLKKVFDYDKKELLIEYPREILNLVKSEGKAEFK